MNKSLVSLIVVSACAGVIYAAGMDFDNSGSLSEAIRAAKTSSVPAAASAALPDWTVMVFVNGKNNLTNYGVSDVNEMEAIGSSDRVKIVVEQGQRINPQNEIDYWDKKRDVGQPVTMQFPVVRMLVQKDYDMARISSPVLQTLDSADMGDWKHLVEFVKWSKDRFPAKKYMLIVWNHGGGWRANSARAISLDEQTGHLINVPDLALALAASGQIDVYASDACLMQMASVPYQLKKYTGYVVGSEALEPGDGYNYKLFLGRLAAKPDASAEELSRMAVDAYKEHYNSENTDATLSYVRTAELDGFVQALDKWVDAVMKADEKAIVKDAMGKAQLYTDDSRDLCHFVTLVGEATKDQSVKQLGAELVSYVTGKVVGANYAHGSLAKNSYGLAIYFPEKNAVHAAYPNTDFAKASKWGTFAAWLAAIK